MKINKKIFIIVGVLVLIGLIFGLVCWFQKTQIPSLSKEEELARFELENPKTANSVLENERKLTISCDDFEIVSEEISCQEAKILALENYLGEIYNITKISSEIDNFWVIEVQQEEKKIEVLINMEGNIIRTK